MAHYVFYYLSYMLQHFFVICHAVFRVVSFNVATACLIQEQGNEGYIYEACQKYKVNT